jgi:flagellar hook-associated protein 2
LNIQSIVSQLVAVESQPVQLLQAKSNTLQTKMSVFGKIKSELSTLQDASQALVDASTWDSKTFASSNTSAITGTATSSALSSAFSVEVTNLAASQSLKTAGVATSFTAPATGTLTFQLGTWNADGSFAGGTATPVSINVASGDSLTTIASNINAKSATAGVSATVVSSNGTQQLLIRGTNTGAAAGFQISASSGLEQFGYTPTATVDGQGVPVVPAAYSSGPLTKTQSAVDASILVEGIVVTSATNTVKDAIPGVTLNLLAKTTSAEQVSVDVDKTAIKAKIQAFQDAYNKLYADLTAQTKYDASTKTGAPLLGDGTTTGIQNMLRSLVGSSGPAASTVNRLSDLGLQIQADGSLSTNSTKLDLALQDPVNVKAFFATNTGTATGNGIAKRIYDFAFGANSVGGTVSTHSAAFQKSIDQNTATIDKFNTHIADYQKQLLAQYTRLDTTMSTLTSLSTFVSQQVAQWNKSS